MGLRDRIISAVGSGVEALADPSRLGLAFDAAIAVVDPERALKRSMARLAYGQGYDAAKPSQYRDWVTGGQAPDDLTRGAHFPVREQARNLQRNYDLARGILRTMANFTVGAQGIQVEPQPRIKGDDGAVHAELARQIDHLWKDWCRRPEVTHTLSFAQCQRLAFISLIRDGEVFAQMLEGYILALDHGTQVPFSIELIEADFVPMDLDDPRARVVQGIEINAWNRPRAYHVRRQHPGASLTLSVLDTKRVSADRILHPRMIDRIGQLRGISEFASIINRLADIKDYEESERIAAKIAASMAAVITKGDAASYGNSSAGWEKPGSPRKLRFRPGMIFDDLLPGESVEVIDAKRPNTGLDAFMQTMTRRASAGVGVGNSSASKNYNGTYSAQRQELVEQHVNYNVLAEHFTAQFVRPTFERFISAAVASGQLHIPPNVDPMSVDDAIYQPQAMPWIDPVKEAMANQILEESLQESMPQIIRRGGRNPREVARQQRRWRQETADLRANAEGSNPQPLAAVAADETARSAVTE